MNPLYVLTLLTLLTGSCGVLHQPLFGAELPTDISEKEKPATIRALLLKGAPRAIVEVRGRYHLYNVATNLLIHSSALSKRKVCSAEGSESLKWGDLFQGTSSLRLVPSDQETTILVDGIQYRGCVEIYNLQGALHIVNEVDIESYLKSILALEFSENLHPALLDALAIIARTNNYQAIKKSPYSLWHVAKEEAGYSGYALTLQNVAVAQAIETTSHAILTYKGEPFAAHWTADSAGKTASFSSIFRKEGASPAGVDAPLAAKERINHKWAFAIPKEEFARLAGTPDVQSVDLYVDPPSGKVYALQVKGEDKAESIDFFNLQKTLGKKLRSNDFTVQLQKDRVLFTGYGEGHGVGLCLYSANLMAERGATAAQILHTFFPGTQLKHQRSISRSEASPPASEALPSATLSSEALPGNS